MTQTTNNGKIMLVGLGPGSHDYLTGRARDAIAEADTVIGYATYIRLVKDLLDGKEVIKKAMTGRNSDRAIEAYDRAKLGKKVALISSGDAGEAGMAGPTFEVLFQAGWTPDAGIEVEIIPGASAINTCASLVGAPLTHDFCAISLSDLLIAVADHARRLDAVAYSGLRRLRSTTRRAAGARGRSRKRSASFCATATRTRRSPSSNQPSAPSSASSSRRWRR